MLAGKTSIFFSTQLEYPPFEPFKISKDAIHRLYNGLREPDGYRYENLDIQATPPFLSTRHDSGESRCEIGPHKIVISEKNPEMPIEEFAGIVKTVLEKLGSDLPPLFMQKCKIQMTAQPSVVEDSVDLLADRVANVFRRIGSFGRPPSYFGVRFRFMPFHMLDAQEREIQSENEPEVEAGVQEIQRETDNPERMIVRPEDAEGFAEVRFESYAKDIKSVWMEIQNSYSFPNASLDEIAKNIVRSHRFLSDKCVDFLSQFDTEHPAEGQ